MTVVSFSMAYRSFWGGSGRLGTRLDTPPSINRRHPNSCLAHPDRQNGSTRREARSAPQQDQEYRLRRESARVITVTMSTAAILSLVNGSEVSALLSALDRYDLHV
jgi:hypothetical protein